MHWFGQMCTFKKERPGEIGARGANLPKKVHLSRIPQCARPGTGIAPAPVADCRLCAPGASAAPVLHPAWQNPAPASPPHRSSTADCATSDSAAPAPLVRTACPPHPVLPDHPQTLTPPANSETPRPPNGRRGVNTQKGSKRKKAYSSAAEVSSTSAASSSVPSSCPPSSGTSATSGTTTLMISISGSSTRVQPPGI